MPAKTTHQVWIPEFEFQDLANSGIGKALNLKPVGSTRPGGEALYEVDLVIIEGDRVPIGFWNYYPDLGMFSPQQTFENRMAYNIFSLDKWGLELDGWYAVGQALSEFLASDAADATSLIDSVKKQFDGAFEGIFGDDIVHPIVLLFEGYTAKARAQMGTDKSLAVEEYDWSLWQKILFSRDTPFLKKIHINPSDKSPNAEGFLAPSVVIPNTDMVTKMPDFFARVANVQEEFHLPTFTAMFRSGSNDYLSPAEAVAINAIEVLKGDREALVYVPGNDSVYPTPTQGDLENIKKEIMEKGWMESNFGKFILKKASKDPNFVGNLFTKQMAKSLDPEKTMTVTTVQVWNQLSKVFEKAAAEFLKIQPLSSSEIDAALKS